MKVLIIEDEQIAADKLTNLVHQYDPEIEILEQFDTVEDTVDWLQENDAPDLLFLDIHLADGSSFEIFDQVEVNCPVIFTTAYDQYAIQAFKIKSVDYLLKPVKFEDLKSALDKYKEIFESNTSDNFSSDMQKLAALIQNQQKEYKSRFLIKVGNIIKTIPVTEVAYFQFEDRATLLITKDNHRYPVNHTLDELEGMLNPKKFARANRQFIITFEAIHKIHPYFKGRLKIDLTPKQSSDLVISAEKAKGFKAWLDQ